MQLGQLDQDPVLKNMLVKIKQLMWAYPLVLELKVVERAWVLWVTTPVKGKKVSHVTYQSLIYLVTTCMLL